MTKKLKLFLLLFLILFGLSFVTIQLTPDLIIEQKENITLIFVGDIMLDRGTEYKVDKYGNGDFKFPFLEISDYFKKADLIFGNLEGPISDKGMNVGSIYSFRADPKAIEGLKSAGFNILSLANNHMFDYSRLALDDTFTRLKENGIDYVGAGLTENEAFSPIVKEIKGTKIAFLAYTNLGSANWKAIGGKSGMAWINENDFERVKKDVQSAKEKNDIVIVSLHAGQEYLPTADQFQTEFSKMAIDAGADLIVGHHPHVIQNNEQYKDGYIFYSLGNFIFDQSFSEQTMQGLILEAVIENKKIKKIIATKTKINNNFQVEIDERERNQELTRVLLSSRRPRQGDTVLIEIAGVKNPEEVEGTFNSKKITFFESKEKVFGLIGLDAKIKIGTYKLSVKIFDEYKIDRQIEVLKRSFPTTNLSFTPELEEQGYNAASVAQTIINNDSVKLYRAMKTSSQIPYFSKSFTYPLVKMANVGAFGNIRESSGVSLQHLGVDLNAKMGTKVYAINDGVVTGVLELIDYGKTVVIDHGLGIFSLYLHLSKPKVSLGQKVAKDQVIGLSGNTGYSIDPHLHLSVRLNGASVDPLKFIQTADFASLK